MCSAVSQFSERFELSCWISNFPTAVPPRGRAAGTAQNSRHKNPRLAVSPLRGVSHFRMQVRGAAHYAARAN